VKFQNVLARKVLMERKEYWLRELCKPLPIMNMPTDFSKFSKNNLEKSSISISLDHSLKKDFNNLDSNFNIKVFMLSAYLVLITRISNEKDILVGVHINNTIYPIRLNIDSIKTFEDLLLLVKDKLDNISKYSFIPEEIVTDGQYEKLLEIVYSMGNDNKLNNESIFYWEVKDEQKNIIVDVNYDIRLFKSETINRFIKYYENIVKAFIKEPKKSIYNINILTQEEMTIYKKLNDTYKELPEDKTITNMFEEAVHKFFNNIAISSEKGQLTYNELNESANKIANGLINKGLKKGDFVTIFMERSLETIVSIMGILKAGGVYASVDPKHPEERNSYIISDVKSPFIITKNIYKNKAQELLSSSESVKEVIIIEKDTNEYSTINPNVDIKPEDLAYVIYTSGSTGKPKGALIAHKGVVNLGFLIRDKLNIDDSDILTQFSTYSFDASVWDTFGSLFWGARLHLLSDEERISIDAFADIIYKIKATHITILPTVFFNQVATYLSEENQDKLATVKRVAVGGEALSGEVVRAFQRKFQNSIEIINLYGPTESTVVATGYKIDHIIKEEQTNIPIGQPFSNYEVYIVNEENQLCPINVPGELYISSVGLAKGYLNQESKTKEVFIKNPFKKDSIIYKSGDIVRMLDNGLVEYVGRKDSQVKVRGYRIEISEIEDNFAKYPKVQDIAVIPIKDNNNENMLVAYYTSENKKRLKTANIKNFLLEKIPAYMIPKYINHLDEMPISPTGKIDRKQLSTYEVLKVVENNNYIAPEDETQNIIANAWKEVLGLEKVSIYDDFFEIGGHSLKIMSVLVLLKPHFKNLTIADFFNYKTVANLAIRIKELQQEKEANNNNKFTTMEVKELTECPMRKIYNTNLDVASKPKNILLTGATGYLGSHILYELIQNTTANIYCLIRQNNNKTLLEKLADTMRVYFHENMIDSIKERVITIKGDLEKENLGLSLKDENFIKENIDTIIHSAADVRHFGDVDHFEKVNIRGTNKLLSIAESSCSGIRFHYISTLGIPEELSLSGKWEEVISKNNLDDDLKLDNVYTNSKLESEKLIYKAAEEVAVTVYRAGNLTCRHDNGKFQKNINNNAFYRMIKSMLLLGKTPEANCYLDFTPIDYASKAIVNLVCKKDTVGETFHICNPNQIIYSTIVEMINKFGYNIEIINQDEYEDYLFDNKISKDKEGVELAIAQLEGDGVKDSCYRFACPNLIKHIDDDFFKYTQVDQQFINNMLSYGIEVGYFPKP
jgi:amino acid adenylation domain-containing protein/thioester reductase-like protein